MFQCKCVQLCKLWPKAGRSINKWESTLKRSHWCVATSIAPTAKRRHSFLTFFTTESCLSHQVPHHRAVPHIISCLMSLMSLYPVPSPAASFDKIDYLLFVRSICLLCCFFAFAYLLCQELRLVIYLSFENCWSNRGTCLALPITSLSRPIGHDFMSLHLLDRKGPEMGSLAVFANL